MAKDRVERQLEHLNSLKVAGPSEIALDGLRHALRDKVNVIVAKAASIADTWQARSLIPDLLQAFVRLFLKAAEADTQCSGKLAIATALKNFGFAESAVFVQGLQHWQWESTWGGKVDTAGLLRGTCALALVQCTDLPREEVLRLLVDSLTEPDHRVRTDACRALEQMGGRDVPLLLRLKARAGDEDVQVTGQVLESVIQLEGVAGVSFVADFLQHKKEDVREEAAMALGASRLPEAFEVLKDEWTRLNGRGDQSVLLRAISASRLDVALEFLLQQIRTARLRIAEDALRAMELHRESEEIFTRVREAVSGREDLKTVFLAAFPGATIT